MCEFCTRHGEGKQWYLQMKNYSNELLHAPISSLEQAAIGYSSRLEWVDDFMKYFVNTAAGAKYAPVSEPQGGAQPAPPAKLSDEQRLSRAMIRHFGQVVPIEDVEKIFGQADSIVRIPCGCRYDNRGLINQRYCFGLGVDLLHMIGKYPESSASLEVLELADAMKLIHKFDDEGLMHSVWTGVTPFVIGVCNCDGDCGAYQGYIKHKGIPSFFRAEYICQVDPDQCTGCRECMSQCQFGAQFYSSSLGKVSIAPELCFGCGVCRSACAQNAITLIPRSESPEAANIWLRS